jgi:hypothetical protein
MIKKRLSRSTCAAAVLAVLAGHAYAADGWKVRFPLSGTLGGEIIAPLNPGMFASVVVTQVEVDNVTGNDGNTLTVPKVGTFSTPAAIAGAVRSASYSGTVSLNVKQSQTVSNLLLGFLSEGEYYGGRFSLTANIPYMSLNRTALLTGDTPALTTLTPALPAPVAAGAQATVQGGFATTYQAQLAASSAAASGSSTGLGDVEVTGAWVQSKDNMKLVLGATLAMPTGQYDKSNPLSISYGNYYTLRPGGAISFKTGENLTLGARASLGLNSPNTDNGIRTGNYWALDMAAAYLTPVGVFGPHLMQVTQYEDDQGGALGANRFSATGAGLFYTTLIKPINAGLNFSYMKMVNSRNALSGSFLQLRLTKAF